MTGRLTVPGMRARGANRSTREMGLCDARWKLKGRCYIGREWEECGKGRVEVWVWMGMGNAWVWVWVWVWDGYACAQWAMGNGAAMDHGPWVTMGGRLR